MYNLPKRPETITYEPDDAEGVEIVLDTLTRRQQAELLPRHNLTQEEAREARRAMERGEEPEVEFEFEMRQETLVDLFDDHLRAVHGVEVGGEEPFDVSNERHREYLHLEWKIGGANRLVQEAFLSDEQGKSSRRPDDDSPRGETPPDTSDPASAASSLRSAG